MKGHEIPLWNKGGYLNTIMDIAHGVTTSTTTKDKSKVVSTTKGYCGVNSPPKASKNVVEHKPSPNYTCDYVVTLDHNGNMVVKYVGAYTKKARGRVCGFQKFVLLTSKDPNPFGYLNQKLKLIL
jgi:hypothetical protein